MPLTFIVTLFNFYYKGGGSNYSNHLFFTGKVQTHYQQVSKSKSTRYVQWLISDFIIQIFVTNQNEALFVSLKPTSDALTLLDEFMEFCALIKFTMNVQYSPRKYSVAEV